MPTNFPMKCLCILDYVQTKKYKISYCYLASTLLFLMSTRGHRMNTSEHTYQCVDTPSGNANPQKWKYSVQEKIYLVKSGAFLEKLAVNHPKGIKSHFSLKFLPRIFSFSWICITRGCIYISIRCRTQNVLI